MVFTDPNNPDIVTYKPEVQRNIVERYYAGLMQARSTPFPNPLPSRFPSPGSWPQWDTPFTKDEIGMYARHKAGSSPGIDNIHLKFLLRLMSLMPEIFLPYLNWAHNHQNPAIPLKALVGRVRLLPKADVIHTPQKTRGITISTGLTNILDGLLHRRFSKVIDPQLHDTIGGFRPYRGVPDCVWLLRTHMLHRMRQKRTTIVAFTDIAKMFDSVPMDVAIIKLEEFVGDGPSVRTYSHMIRNGMVAFALNGVYGAPLRWGVGVPHGRSTSTLMPNILFNHIPTLMLEHGMGVQSFLGRFVFQSYADDTVNMTDSVTHMRQVHDMFEQNDKLNHLGYWAIGKGDQYCSDTSTTLQTSSEDKPIEYSIFRILLCAGQNRFNEAFYKDTYPFATKSRIITP